MKKFRFYCYCPSLEIDMYYEKEEQIEIPEELCETNHTKIIIKKDLNSIEDGANSYQSKNVTNKLNTTQKKTYNNCGIVIKNKKNKLRKNLHHDIFIKTNKNYFNRKFYVTYSEDIIMKNSQVFIVHLIPTAFPYSYIELLNSLGSHIILQDYSENHPYVIICGDEIEKIVNCVYVKEISKIVCEIVDENTVTNYNQIVENQISVSCDKNSRNLEKIIEKYTFNDFNSEKFINHVYSVIRSPEEQTYRICKKVKSNNYEKFSKILFGRVDLVNATITYKIVEIHNKKYLAIHFSSIRKKVLNAGCEKRVFVGRCAMDAEMSMFMYNMVKNHSGFDYINNYNNLMNNGHTKNKKSSHFRNKNMNDINMSEFKHHDLYIDKHHIVLDPFCGSAGILLICAINNTFVIGSDININEMVGTNDYFMNNKNGGILEQIQDKKEYIQSMLKGNYDNPKNFDKFEYKTRGNNHKYVYKNNINDEKIYKISHSIDLEDNMENFSDKNGKVVSFNEICESHIYTKLLHFNSNPIILPMFSKNLLIIPSLSGCKTNLRNTNVLSNFYQFGVQNLVLGFFVKSIDRVLEIFDEDMINRRKYHSIFQNDEDNLYLENKQDFAKKNSIYNNSLSIVTDLPYGIRTPIKASTIQVLISSLFNICNKLFVKKERVCFSIITGYENYIEQTFSKFILVMRVYQKLKMCERVFYCYEYQ